MISFGVHRVTEITDVSATMFKGSDKDFGFINIKAMTEDKETIDITLYSKSLRELIGQLAGSAMCQLEEKNRDICE